jgi:hypothetical protein
LRHSHYRFVILVAGVARAARERSDDIFADLDDALAAAG